jgi:hypothetical protein
MVEELMVTTAGILKTFHLIVRCAEHPNEAKKRALHGDSVGLRDGCLFVSGPNR